MNLDEARMKIDSLDEELVRLIEERMDIVAEIGRYKQECHLSIFDYEREKLLLEKINRLSRDDLRDYNRLLFTTIMELSKDYQRKVTAAEFPLVHEMMAAINKTPRIFPERAMVACQGVAGAYSEQAGEKIFKYPQIIHVKSFEAVFAAIDSGLCEYGVLPIENSTAGSVNQIYDLMMDYQCYIVKSLKMRIDHSLLAKQGVTKEAIREIVSHEQALAQCEGYLKNLSNVKITVFENTAAAAKYVSESNRKDVAALASHACGKIYGLTCLEEGIQDNHNNYTRFICISKKLQVFPGANRTSVMMVIDHRPGSLYNVLARFNAMGINLLKLESRPIAKREFEFMFYFDIECSVYSDAFIRMISQLAEMSREFQYLGSYSEG